MSDSRRREVRSFVLRTGRLTVAQQRAIEELGPRYLVPADGETLQAATLYGRSAPLVLEIGFGMGQSLLEQAQAAPELDFLGIEVHPPGVGSLLHGIAERELQNLRAWNDDAVPFLRDRVADASLQRVQVFFPDPWHKKRHHKRRLIQPEFVALLVRKLQPGGALHLATDWQNYAEHMLEVLAAAPGLRNLSPTGDYVDGSGLRPRTKFEARGERLGHGVWDLHFVRD